MLFRSVIAGLIAAVFVLMVQNHNAHHDTVVIEHAAPATPQVTPATGLALIDVSSAMPRDSLVDLVVLAPGEYIMTVDDHAVGSPAQARSAIAGHAGAYIDLAIGNERFDNDAPLQRRVVLLLH